MTKYFSLLITVIFMSGCSTTKPVIGKLPVSNADYMQSPIELRTTYLDIDKHDGPLAHGIFGTIWDMPEMEGVTSKLGDPDKKRPSWWNVYPPLVLAAVGLPPAWVVGGSALIISFHPTSVYHWDKPNYEIEAVVDHPMAFDYEPHLMYWRWKHSPKTEMGVSRQELSSSNGTQR